MNGPVWELKEKCQAKNTKAIYSRCSIWKSLSVEKGTNPDLIYVLGTSGDPSTIRWSLIRNVLIGRLRSVKMPFLILAKLLKSCTEYQWQQVLWNESKLEILGSNCCQYVWGRSGERHTRELRKTMELLSWFGHSFRTVVLMILSKPMNTEKWHQILTHYVISSGKHLVC